MLDDHEGGCGDIDAHLDDHCGHQKAAQARTEGIQCRGLVYRRHAPGNYHRLLSYHAALRLQQLTRLQRMVPRKPNWDTSCVPEKASAEPANVGEKRC